MDTKERWKTFPRDKRYQVSNFGRVRFKPTMKVRNPTVKQNGYPGIVITAKGKKTIGFDLHTMVAITWMGKRPEGYDVSHQDGNKLNNRLDNLKYESRKENANKHFNKYTHEYRRVLTPELVARIRRSRRSNQWWARKVGVGRMTIWKVRKYVTWKHLP